MKVIDKFKKTINSLNNNISKLFSFTPDDSEEKNIIRKSINSSLIVMSFLLFILSVVGIIVGLKFVMGKHDSKIRYIEEDGIRYIELVDGFIKEELVVETGTILPELKNYFREDYKIADNVSAQYFENNNALSLEQFTNEVDGEYYLKGIRTINVIIFGDYEYETKLSIVDTTSPSFTLKEVSIPADGTLDLNNFVASYNDNSEIDDHTVSFKEDYDLSKEGTYDVTVIVCDISNNCNEGNTKITITKAENNSSNSGNGNTGNGGNSSGNKKPSSGSSNKKPSSGSGNKNSGSGNKNSGSGSNSGGSSSTKPSNTIYSFDDSNVITPEYRKCSTDAGKKNNYDIVIDHYGTTETIHFDYVDYTRDTNCQYHINNYTYMYTPTIKYADNGKFTGTAKTMLEEAMYVYNTKNDPKSGYQNTLNNYLNLTNTARKEAGLKEVELNYHLCMVATMRAIELAYSGIAYEGHYRPNGTKWTTLWDEYGLSTPSKKAENIAFNFTTDQSAFNALMKSTSHRNTILTGMYTKMGIGKFTFNKKTYTVQIFST